MEEQGIRISDRYPRLLSVYGAWIGAGVVFALIASEQWILGIILSGLTMVIVAVGIRGSRKSERIYQRWELRLQWLFLILPVGFIGILILLLGRYIAPLLGYLIGYYLVLVILGILTARELFQAEPAR